MRKDLEKAINVIFASLAQTSQLKYKAVFDCWRKSADPLEATSLDALAFFNELKNKRTVKGNKICGETRRLYIVILNSIYRSLIDFGLVNKNPFAGLSKKIPKSPNEVRPIKLTNIKEVHRLFEACSKYTKKGIVKGAMLTLLYGCGRRVGELHQLTLGDVQYTDDGTLYIQILRTKNKRMHIAVVPDSLKYWIETLVELRKHDGATERSKLFVVYRSNGTPKPTMSKDTLRMWFKQIAEEAGIKGISSHSGRATSITKLLSEGNSYKSVQDFSGHCSISMVERYDKRRFVISKAISKSITY